MQLRNFRCICPLISKTAAITLANLFIYYCLDYCNSLFSGLPNYSIHRQQKVQNTAARIVVVSLHHITLRFLNLCIGYLLTTILISRFVASLIVRCLYMNLIILVLCSAFDIVFIPFVFPLSAHY